MAEQRIYLSPPLLQGNERQYLLEALDSNWIAPLGPFVDRLEQNLCQRLQTPHVIPVNSGTSALHLALRLCGVQNGDEVICPTFSFIASAAPVTYLGARPVFVDCEATTWNMDLNLIEEAIVQRRQAGAQVKAVVFAYSYGIPGHMSELVALCDRYDLPLIEDAAEALGSSWQNQAAGTFGRFGVLSFNGNKIITGSTGGALICQQKSDAQQARKLAAQAKETTLHFEHHSIGYNYGLSNLVAAVLVAQLEQLDHRIALHRTSFDHYQDQLQNQPSLDFPQEISGAFANRWLSAFTLTPQHAQWLLKQLLSHNIEARPLWMPLHQQQAFGPNPICLNRGVSESLFARGICLPSRQAVTLPLWNENQTKDKKNQ